MNFEANDDEFEGDEDDDGLNGTETVRAKWVMDGASTLQEAASQVRDFANYLDSLAQEGYELLSPVADDYGFIRK